jgi:hypothetical protein
MTGLSDYSAEAQLNWLTGKLAVPALPTVYLALFTAAGTDDGSGFTEPAGASYARVATSPADWSAASGTGPSGNQNGGAFVFPTPTEDWGSVLAFGLYDQQVGGNLLFSSFLGGFRWQPAYVAQGTPGTFNVSAHGFIIGDKLIFSTEICGHAPALSQSNLNGLLTVAHAPTADTFDVTSGGGVVNVSASGGGTVLKVAVQSVLAGITVSFAAGNLTLLAA